MEAEVCLEKCGKELNNEHLVCCGFINEDNEHRYNDILNGDLQDKIMTLQQIQRNEKIRKEERKKKINPVIQLTLVDPLNCFS